MKEKYFFPYVIHMMLIDSSWSSGTRTIPKHMHYYVSNVSINDCMNE